MGRLINADLWIDNLSKSFVAPNYHPDLGDAFQCMEIEQHNEDTADLIMRINEQPTALEDGFEIRLLKNYLSNMPKTYRARHINWVIVRDLLMSGTSTAGMTSCITKCHDLGIDPWGYELKGAVKDE